MYLSKITLPNMEKTYDFSEDINIIANDNIEIFLNLGYALDCFIKCKGFSSNFRCGGIEPNIAFTFKEQNKEYQGICTYNKKMEKNNSSPIMSCYIDNNRSKWFLELSCVCEPVLPRNYYDCALEYECLVQAQKCFINMFFYYNKGLTGQKVKNFDYIAFHCENIKNKINTFLNEVKCCNFNFSFAKGTFVYERNGVIIDNRTTYWKIINVFMDLYYKCMIKNPKALETVTDENGIMVMFDNFGERPSYSDNKWVYYNFLKSVFKNFQIITI